MKESKFFDIHKPWKLKNDSRLPKRNPDTLFQISLKTIRKFHTKFNDLLHRYSILPVVQAKNLSFLVPSFFHTQIPRQFLSTLSSEYTKNLISYLHCSPGPNHLLPRSPQFLPTHLPLPFLAPWCLVSKEQTR